eukprot:g4526.t1
MDAPTQRRRTAAAYQREPPRFHFLDCLLRELAATSKFVFRRCQFLVGASVFELLFGIFLLTVLFTLPYFSDATNSSLELDIACGVLRVLGAILLLHAGAARTKFSLRLYFYLFLIANLLLILLHQLPQTFDSDALNCQCRYSAGLDGFSKCEFLRLFDSSLQNPYADPQFHPREFLSPPYGVDFEGPPVDTSLPLPMDGSSGLFGTDSSAAGSGQFGNLAPHFRRPPVRPRRYTTMEGLLEDLGLIEKPPDPPDELVESHKTIVVHHRQTNAGGIKVPGTDVQFPIPPAPSFMELGERIERGALDYLINCFTQNPQMIDTLYKSPSMMTNEVRTALLGGKCSLGGAATSAAAPSTRVLLQQPEAEKAPQQKAEVNPVINIYAGPGGAAGQPPMMSPGVSLGGNGIQVAGGVLPPSGVPAMIYAPTTTSPLMGVPASTYPGFGYGWGAPAWNYEVPGTSSPTPAATASASSSKDSPRVPVSTKGQLATMQADHDAVLFSVSSKCGIKLADETANIVKNLNTVEDATFLQRHEGGGSAPEGTSPDYGGLEYVGAGPGQPSRWFPNYSWKPVKCGLDQAQNQRSYMISAPYFAYLFWAKEKTQVPPAFFAVVVKREEERYDSLAARAINAAAEGVAAEGKHADGPALPLPLWNIGKETTDEQENARPIPASPGPEQDEAAEQEERKKPAPASGEDPDKEKVKGESKEQDEAAKQEVNGEPSVPEDAAAATSPPPAKEAETSFIQVQQTEEENRHDEDPQLSRDSFFQSLRTILGRNGMLTHSAVDGIVERLANDKNFKPTPVLLDDEIVQKLVSKILAHDAALYYDTHAVFQQPHHRRFEKVMSSSGSGAIEVGAQEAPPNFDEPIDYEPNAEGSSTGTSPALVTGISTAVPIVPGVTTQPEPPASSTIIGVLPPAPAPFASSAPPLRPSATVLIRPMPKIATPVVTAATEEAPVEPPQPRYEATGVLISTEERKPTNQLRLPVMPVFSPDPKVPESTLKPADCRCKSPCFAFPERYLEEFDQHGDHHLTSKSYVVRLQRRLRSFATDTLSSWGLDDLADAMKEDGDRKAGRISGLYGTTVSENKGTSPASGDSFWKRNAGISRTMMDRRATNFFRGQTPDDAAVLNALVSGPAATGRGDAILPPLGERASGGGRPRETARGSDLIAGMTKIPLAVGPGAENQNSNAGSLGVSGVVVAKTSNTVVQEMAGVPGVLSTPGGGPQPPPTSSPPVDAEAGGVPSSFSSFLERLGVRTKTRSAPAYVQMGPRYHLRWCELQPDSVAGCAALGLAVVQGPNNKFYSRDACSRTDEFNCRCSGLFLTSQPASEQCVPAQPNLSDEWKRARPTYEEYVADEKSMQKVALKQLNDEEKRKKDPHLHAVMTAEMSKEVATSGSAVSPATLLITRAATATGSGGQVTSTGPQQTTDDSANAPQQQPQPGTNSGPATTGTPGAGATPPNSAPGVEAGPAGAGPGGTSDTSRDANLLVHEQHQAKNKPVWCHVNPENVCPDAGLGPLTTSGFACKIERRSGAEGAGWNWNPAVAEARCTNFVLGLRIALVFGVLLTVLILLSSCMERMRLLSALDTSLGARMDRFSLNAFEICVLKFLKLPGIEKGILRIVFAFMDHCHTGSAIVGAPLPAFDVRFQKKFLPAIDRRSFVFLRVLSTTASFAGMHESVAFQDYVHVDTMFVELRALLAQNGVLLPEERPDERYRGDGYPFRIVVFSPGPSAGPGGGTTGAGSRTAVEVGRAPLEPSVVIVPPIPGLPIKYDTTLERLVRGLEKMLGNGNPARKSSNTSRIDLQSGAAELYGLPHGTCLQEVVERHTLPGNPRRVQVVCVGVQNSPRVVNMVADWVAKEANRIKMNQDEQRNEKPAHSMPLIDPEAHFENGGSVTPWSRPLDAAERAELRRFLEYAEYDELPRDDASSRREISFIEIGTSNYNTISQAVFPMPDGTWSDCSSRNRKHYGYRFPWMWDHNRATGLAIDVIPWVLDELPAHANLLKHSLALSGPGCEGETQRWHELGVAERTQLQDAASEIVCGSSTASTATASPCSFVSSVLSEDDSGRAGNDVGDAPEDQRKFREDHDVDNVRGVLSSVVGRPATVYYVEKARIDALMRSHTTGEKCELHGKESCWACWKTGELACACASVNQRPSYFIGRLRRLGMESIESQKETRSVTYTEVMLAHGILRPELLHLDCEGLDFAIVRGMLEFVYRFGPAARPKQLVFEATSGRKYVAEVTPLIRALLQVGYLLESDPFYEGDDEIDSESETMVRNISLVLSNELTERGKMMRLNALAMWLPPADDRDTSNANQWGPRCLCCLKAGKYSEIDGALKKYMYWDTAHAQRKECNRWHIDEATHDPTAAKEAGLEYMPSSVLKLRANVLEGYLQTGTDLAKLVSSRTFSSIRNADPKIPGDVEDFGGESEQKKREKEERYARMIIFRLHEYDPENHYDIHQIAM